MVWRGTDGELRRLGEKNQHRRLSSTHTELEVPMCAMKCLLQYTRSQAFGTDCQNVTRMTLRPEE